MGAVEVVLTSFKMPFEKRETFRVTGFQLIASLVILLLSIIPLIMLFSGTPIDTDFSSPGMEGIVLTFIGTIATIIFIDIILLWIINAWTTIMFANQVNTIYSKSTVAFKDLMDHSKAKITTVIGIDIILSLVMVAILSILGFFMLSGPLNTFTTLSGAGPVSSIALMQNFSNAIKNISNLFSLIALLIAPLFILAIPIAVLEKKGAIESLKQSFEIGKQNYLSLVVVNLLMAALTLILLILIILIMLILTGITVLIFGLVGGVIVGTLIYFLLITYLITISGVISTVAYFSYVKGKDL